MSNQIEISHLSPLRYPGSKKKLVAYLYSIINHNNIKPKVLIEPFLGGGNVSLHFLKNGVVDEVIASDSDKLIYSFWNVLFFKTDYLIDFIKRIRISLKNFYFYKDIARNSDKYNEETLSEACVFLNRTSFSGILTNGAGPIGGSKQKSEYVIGCRFTKKNIISRIKALSSLRTKIKLLFCSWEETIAYSKNLFEGKNNKNDILFYFDPPFYLKGDKLYRNYFTKNDHENFCAKIQELDYNWILSYDNAKEIKRLYSKKITTHIEMSYSLNSHAVRIEKELIITPLSLPKFK